MNAPTPFRSDRKPAWMHRLSELFMSGEASVFVLHGNVHDYALGPHGFAPLRRYLSAWMHAAKPARHVYEMDLRHGLMELKDNDQPPIENRQDGLAMTSLLHKTHGVLHGKKPAMVSMPYADSFLPGGETQHLTSEERALLASIHEWSLDPSIAKDNNLLILQVESLSLLPSSLISNPRVACISVDLPDEETRRELIALCLDRDNDIDDFVRHTAGLKAIQIASILGFNKKEKGMSEQARRDALVSMLKDQEHTPEALEKRVSKLMQVTQNMSLSDIAEMLGTSVPQHQSIDDQVINVLLQRKRAIIEKECAGLLEFVDTKHGLDSVGGNEEIKRELMRIAEIVRDGNKRLAPMGLLAVGPMGAGKTFVIKAFLKEAGLPGVALKNIRSKWVGSTETNLEKVLATIKAMGPVALIIDEADRSFGKGDGESDGGTNSRIVARMKEFMSDPENRGRVLFIMMTNRPDKLDTDIKRPGRLDQKIPFFYAQKHEDALNIIQVLLRRYDVNVDLTIENTAALLNNKIGVYSNADYEAVVGLCANLLTHEEYQSKPLEALTQAFNDFIPSQEKGMLEYMELQAVREASRKSLVPPKFHAYYEGTALDDKLKSFRHLL